MTPPTLSHVILIWQGCAELKYTDHMSMAFALGLGHGLSHSMFFFLG